MFRFIKRYFANTDLYLLVLSLLCSAYGMVLIYSATLSTDTSRYMTIQGVAILIGIGAFILMSLTDLESWSGLWRWFYIANVLLQCLLIPFGVERNGQRAWIELPFTSFQPGELGKLIFIFTLAAHISQLRDSLKEIRGVFILAVHIMTMMAVIVLTSKDSGMAIQYFIIGLVMLFAAGMPLRWIFSGIGIGIASIPILWNFVLRDYQRLRILSLFDPDIDPTSSWQTVQGKIAIGSGQLFGQGLGSGAMSQMHIVPENRTDYIFSVAGEELGFVGCLVIIFLLMLLIIRLFYISYLGNTNFSSYLAVGIAGMFLFQTFMNIFMCIGLLPIMGLTLPFFSYGGTSILTMFAALGIAAGVRMREKPSWLQ